MKGFWSLVLITVLTLGISIHAFATEVTLAWDANSESDLAGYRIFQRVPDALYNYLAPDWEGTAITCTLTVPDGPYECCFVARAFDKCGNESGDSNEVRYDTRPPADPNLHTDSSNLCKADYNQDGKVTRRDRRLFIKAYRAELGRKDCLVQ